MTDVLRALIAELEQATEGSHELDFRVLAACGFKHAVGGEGATHYFVWPDWPEHCRPEPTRSLDAALTLVPEDGRLFLDTMTPRDWHGGSAKGKRRAPSATIEIARLRDSYFGEGESLALALCIAALKARLGND